MSNSLLSRSRSFFFNVPATSKIYTLSLHDALPIWNNVYLFDFLHLPKCIGNLRLLPERSEEHTYELQSPMYLVCRLLLEKKNEKPELEQPFMGCPHGKGKRRGQLQVLTVLIAVVES